MKDQYNSKSMGGRGPISTDRNTVKPIRSAHLDICEKHSNSLTSKSDQHLISPNGITPESNIKVMSVVSSRLSQVTPFIAIAQLNFIKESTSYIHNTILGISNTTFT